MTYNELLESIDIFPIAAQREIKKAYLFGIRSVTGAGIMDIKRYVEDHPDDTFYDVDDMKLTFKTGKI